MKLNDGTDLDDLDPEEAWFGDPDEDDGVTLPPAGDVASDEVSDR